MVALSSGERTRSLDKRALYNFNVVDKFKLLCQSTLFCGYRLALDVLLCTASIFSLCAISLDRYWSITMAVTYLQRRTPRHAVLMITAVWISSLIISVPPLLGWRNPPNATEIVTFDNGTVRHSAFVKTCSVGEDTSVYVIFSSLG